MSNNVICQVLGGEKKVVDGISTVADARRAMNATGLTASINGSPAQDHEPVESGDFVSFAQAVKGGLN